MGVMSMSDSSFLTTVFVAAVISFLTTLFLHSNGRSKDKCDLTPSGIVSSMSGAVDAAKRMAPTNPALQIADQILKFADTAVRASENRYLNGKIEKDARKTEATNFIVSMLVGAGVEITAEIRQAISSAIDTTVAQLPKTDDSLSDPAKTE